MWSKLLEIGRSGRKWFVALSVVVFSMFTYLFYSAFYAIEIRADRLDLVYPWPRPAVMIKWHEIERGQFVGGRRRLGELGTFRVIAKGHVYSSTTIYTYDVVGE